MDSAVQPKVRGNFLDYIWDKLIMPQAGYSFSKNHTVPYSIVAIQEGVLATKYPSQYWNGAVLSVNSGSTAEDGSTDYSKIAKAVSSMQADGVNITLPSINSSELGFSPHKTENKILYGLSAIQTINHEIANEIINNRPYVDFRDFYDRIYQQKLIKKGAMVNLIKSGVFDDFDERFDIMKEFITLEYEEKTSLNMQNWARITSLGLSQSNEYISYLATFKSLLDEVKKHKKGIVETFVKPKDSHILLPEMVLGWYIDNVTTEDRMGFEVDIVDEVPVVSLKNLEKFIKKKIEPIKDWLGKASTLQMYNNSCKNEMWNDIALGSYAEWEMKTLCYYHSPHPLLTVDRDRYGFKNFFDMNPIPQKVGRSIPLERIFGTVIDKNKDKNIVTLLTTDGVVTCKYYAGSFENFNKRITRPVGKTGKSEVVEQSWFTRGNYIALVGFRRDDQFIIRSQKRVVGLEHSTMLITNITSDGGIYLKEQRERG